MCSRLSSVAKRISESFDGAKFRAAIVTIGGESNLIHGFGQYSNDQLEQKISSLPCSNNPHEASLEGIRNALKSENIKMSQCKENCVFTWKSDATKIVVLITDEDSDLPFSNDQKYAEQRRNSFCDIVLTKPLNIYFDESNFVNQQCANGRVAFEPSMFPAMVQTNRLIPAAGAKLSRAYQMEIEETANVVRQSNAILITITDSSNAGYQRESVGALSSDICKQQYGDPSLNVINEKRVFDIETTLMKLQQSPYYHSLQANLLKSNSYHLSLELEPWLKESAMNLTYTVLACDKSTKSQGNSSTVNILNDIPNIVTPDKLANNPSVDSESMETRLSQTPFIDRNQSTSNRTSNSTIRAELPRNGTSVSTDYDKDKTSSKSNSVPIVAGSVCAGLAVLGAIILAMYRRRNKPSPTTVKPANALSATSVAATAATTGLSAGTFRNPASHKRFSALYFDSSSPTVDDLVNDIRPVSFIYEHDADNEMSPLSPHSVVVVEEFDVC